MYKNTKPYFVFMLTLAVLVSCSRSPFYYAPNRVNTPLLSEAGQVEFCVAPNNTQVAYSPIKNLGVIGGYSLLSSDYFRDFGKENAGLFEIGGGYYHHIDTPRRGETSGMIYDIYGGYGMGRVTVNNNSSIRYPSMNVSRVFIQPGIGVRTINCEFSVNWRLCNVRYNNFNLPANSESPKENKDYFFSEPSITLRFGYKPVKLEIQYINSDLVSKEDWKCRSGVLNVGICAIIGGYK